MPEIIQPEEPGLLYAVLLSDIVSRIATITGLDWFATEIIAAGTTAKLQTIVTEPANALAGLGPGVKALSALSVEVARIAAQRIAEVAWRHSQGLPFSEGRTIQYVQ